MENYPYIPTGERWSYINNVLQRAVMIHDDIVGIWTIWDPDVFEGNDRQRYYVIRLSDII